MSKTNDARYALLNHQGQPLGDHSVADLATLWQRGEIGPRTLLRNLQTGEEAYVDQIVPEPPVHTILAPPTQKSSRIPIVAAVVAVFAITASVAAAYISHQRKLADTRLEQLAAAKILRHNYQALLTYTADHNGLTPPEHTMLGSAFLPPGSPAAPAAAPAKPLFTDRFNNHPVEFNYQLGSKDWANLKNKENVWLFAATGNWYNGKTPIITGDGKTVLVPTIKFYEVRTSVYITDEIKDSSPL